jgi:hypothetical protein
LDVPGRILNVLGETLRRAVPMIGAPRNEELEMRHTSRAAATAVAVVGVLATGGMAMASGLSAARPTAAPAAPSPDSSDDQVAILAAQLADLGVQADLLGDDVVTTEKAIREAAAAEAARAAAAQRAAELAAAKAAKAQAKAAARASAQKHAAPAPKPSSHTSTGASGSGSGEHESDDEGEHEEESDD